MKYSAFNKVVMPEIWHLPQLLRIMRITAFLLLCGLLQVSASGFSQKLTIQKNQATLKEIFTEITRQTGYDIVVDARLLKHARSVDARFHNTELEEVLNQILNRQNLDYTIKYKTVVIKRKEGSFIETFQESVTGLFRKDSVIFKGQVLNEYGLPLPGASVKIKGSKKSTFTTEKGAFTIFASPKAVLQVSYIGYDTQELQMRREDAGTVIKFNMKVATKDLGEVAIVSNGYQDIPKERATGSFEFITKEQLQHSNDPNLLKRLEGITTSMDFRNELTPTNSAELNESRRSPFTNLTIRGRNTLTIAGLNNNSGRVLVVIDGIASPYSIDQVNPNDVENITILKDAAAASIWGSRAANGVIVIKTKKGRYQSPLQIEFNSNVNVTEKPDLFYRKYMSTSDYVDAQMFKYEKDYPGASDFIPAPQVNTGQLVFSPVAEIMDRKKRLQIDGIQAKAELDALRGNDIRNDLTKYFYRNAVTQSHSLALSGGTKEMAQRLSAGYDKTLNNTLNAGNNRLVLNYGVSVKPIAKLDLYANVVYSRTVIDAQSGNGSFSGAINATGIAALYPYLRLADDQGNPLAIPKAYGQPFLDLLAATYGAKILSYEYKPLEDLNYGYYKNKTQNVNVNAGGNYQIIPALSANITYNYNTGNNEGTNLDRQESWYMRDKINSFTDPVNLYDLYTFAPLIPGTRNLPLGGQYTKSLIKSSNHTLRGQLDFNKTWNEKHMVSAMAGIDFYKSYSIIETDGYYGYNEKDFTTVRNLNFDYYHFFLFGDPLSGAGVSRIPVLGGNMGETRDRTISYFSNAGYTFDNRYTVTASFRRDLSALFSSLGNNGGTPFYSVGGSWNISNEKFYHFSLLPLLQLKATFGYNGNTNPVVSSYPVLNYTPKVNAPDGNNLAYSSALNAANAKLRPEKTEVLNLALSFGVKGGRLSGGVEYYVKRTSDLLTQNSTDPSIGFNYQTTNTGNLLARGVELSLNSLNVQSGAFRWNSNFLFSYNRVKISKLFSAINVNASTRADVGIVFTEGYELSSTFAFRWAGLDPVTGDPMGYVNGNAVTINDTEAGRQAYSDILGADFSTLHYFGSRIPVYYGSFRNTFSYGNFSVSANLIYKLGYWFRRPFADMVQYSNLFGDGNLQGAEYANRWQKPGDEKFTNVPSFTYPVNVSRDAFYRLSDVNIQNGNHIRLQELNLSYGLNKNKWFLKNPRIYANLPLNIMIWRANKLGLDPDINDLPRPRTYGIGFSANF